MCRKRPFTTAARRAAHPSEGGGSELVCQKRQRCRVAESTHASQRFTDGMKSGLVLAKRDVTLLRRKFGHLAIREIHSEHDAMVAVSDIDLFVLSSLTDQRQFAKLSASNSASAASSEMSAGQP